MTVFTFGPFRLVTDQRTLERDGKPWTVGSRSLDLLTILLLNSGKIVTKEELIAHAWPNTTVEESSLRVHIAGLRKALQDDDGRYVRNVPGRGYCFVHSVEIGEGDRTSVPLATTAQPNKPRRDLPMLLTKLVGRERDITEIKESLIADRFVSIVASGGVGKTSIAVALSHRLFDVFEHGVVFVDLSSLASGDMLGSTVARAFGLEASSEGRLDHLLESLRDRKFVIVLDNCEHVIDDVTIFCETLIGAVPEAHILTTSREVLRAAGEVVYNLSPLRSPGLGEAVLLEDIAQFSALEMFFDRAAAGGMRATPTVDDLPKVATVCRRLDGIPLALELAAGRVAAYGIDGLLELLENRFRLHWRGRRAAMERHQTLRAMFDWSYNLLDDYERAAFRFMSTFAGRFSIEAACAVLAPLSKTKAEIFDICEGLASKSMISPHYSAADGQHYRLSETARAYAGERLAQDHDEFALAKGSHARFYAEFAQKFHVGTGLFNIWTKDHVPADLLADIRLALTWSFDKSNDRSLGIELLASSWTLFSEPALVRECFNWALKALDEAETTEISLETESAICEALTFTGILVPSGVERTKSAALRCIEICEQLGLIYRQLRVLAAYNVFIMRLGDNREGLEAAEKFSAVANSTGDVETIRTAQWMMGTSRAYLGDFRQSLAEFRDSLPHYRTELDIDFLGFLQLVRARLMHARAMWAQGQTKTSVQLTYGALDEARAYRNPICLSIALSHAAGILLWDGDHEGAGVVARELVSEASRHGLTSFRALGIGIEGHCAVLSGDLEAGKRLLKVALHQVEEQKHANTATSLLSAMAEACLVAGEAVEALQYIDLAIVRAKETGELFQLADLHRVRAQILWRAPNEASKSAAVDAFREALDIANEQGAFMWVFSISTTMLETVVGTSYQSLALDQLAQVICGLPHGFEAEVESASRLIVQAGGNSKSDDGCVTA